MSVLFDPFVCSCGSLCLSFVCYCLLLFGVCLVVCVCVLMCVISLFRSDIYICGFLRLHLRKNTQVFNVIYVFSLLVIFLSTIWAGSCMCRFLVCCVCWMCAIEATCVVSVLVCLARCVCCLVGVFIIFCLFACLSALLVLSWVFVMSFFFVLCMCVYRGV